MLDDGFKLIDNFISEDQINNIVNELNSFPITGKVGGLRNANAKLSTVGAYAKTECVLEHAAQFLPSRPMLVRAIIFNKTHENNWLVTWHQDKTVAVSEKFELGGWGPWSVKDGTIHAQPPLEVLDQMVTFRIHLDDSNLENGCLRVIPGSHNLGIIPQASIAEHTSPSKSHECIATRGSALVMRPHILHASSKGSQPSQRRVLHLEFSSYQLPPGITWA